MLLLEVSLPVKQVRLRYDDETAVAVGLGAMKKKRKKKSRMRDLEEEGDQLWLGS